MPERLISDDNHSLIASGVCKKYPDFVRLCEALGLTRLLDAFVSPRA